MLGNVAVTYKIDTEITEFLVLLLKHDPSYCQSKNYETYASINNKYITWYKIVKLTLLENPRGINMYLLTTHVNVYYSSQNVWTV